MADLSLPASTLEYVRFPVRATVNGLPYNPTSDVVQFAFLTLESAQPVGGDWKSGSWETGANSTYLARCLVGPSGTVTLTAGLYYVWIKITDSPEIPVILAGTVEIT